MRKMARPYSRCAGDLGKRRPALFLIMAWHLVVNNFVDKQPSVCGRGCTGLWWSCEDAVREESHF